MSKAILGTKLGMSQVFAANGDLIPVTVVEVKPNVVVAVKSVESDGYNAVQLGYGEVKDKHLTKPVKGQFEKAGVAPVKYLREYRLAEKPEYTVGQTLAADIFAEGEVIDVIGTSKGKGYAGTIKRWNFRRGPESNAMQVPLSVGTSAVDRNPTVPRTIVSRHLSVLVCLAAAARCLRARSSRVIWATQELPCSI